MTTLAELLTYTPVELSFGTSGLRGLVTDMTDLECYINTAGFLRFVAGQQQLAQGSTVYVAGDLRDSTPRIIGAVIAAITDAGYTAIFLGLIPTPALACMGLKVDAPSIMVTGSHIPADRNGIKFYKRGGEILKDDEAAIKQAVGAERARIMAVEQTLTPFGSNGFLKTDAVLPAVDPQAAADYIRRFTTIFADKPLVGKDVVVYQHSAVGRDMLVDLLTQLGANILPVGRSDTFVSIDTENVTPDDQAYFTQLAEQHPHAFAIVSTDGDSDRPFVIDENGLFHRGDELGAVVADWLDADFAAIPVSSNDAVDDYLAEKAIACEHTRIGSPYVIVAMQRALGLGRQRTVGWEVNGGFLTGNDFVINGETLSALPTRDAFFPILIALIAATEKQQAVSELFAQLPARFTQAGLIDNFPVDTSRALVATYALDSPENRRVLEGCFSAEDGFGSIVNIDSLDGIRIFFDNGDIAHMRPSGNAPQLRIYSVADSQQRANDIVERAIAEPAGLLRRLAQQL